MNRDVDDLLQLIQREAERVAHRIMPTHRFGTVAAYNPADSSVRLHLLEDLDENGAPSLSPWMPVVMPSARAGAGDIAAPMLGDQMLSLNFYGEGSGDRFSYAIGAVRSQQDSVPAAPGVSGDPPPPAGPSEGDRWIVHPSGQGIYLLGDGTVLVGKQGGPFQRLATESFVLNDHNNHTHKYQPGDGALTDTQPPTQQVSSSSTISLTAQLKGT